MTGTDLSRAAYAALLAAAFGCSGDLTLPDSSGSGLGLAPVGGNGQTGTVGSPLPSPLVVRVAGAGDTPAAGRRVAFVPLAGADGSMDPDTAVTNSQGEAFSIWVLGTEPGEHQVEARLVADEDQPPPVAFSASVLAGEPDTLRAVGPLSRPGRRRETLSEPLVVHVSDRYGNSVVGATVRWDVTAGEGEVDDSETETGSDGNTQVIWTLGKRIGVQKVTASIPDVHGSPVTFSAIVLF